VAKQPAKLRSLLLGGLLPVIAFTVIEEVFGTLWGLVAGMVFGVGEILWELKTKGRVEAMTWGGNGMLLVLGAVSLLTQDGIWFKLQPSILEAVMAVVLWGSVLIGKPLMLQMMIKMMGNGKEATLKPEALPILKPALAGMTLRMGLFFGVHAGLAAWAALYWSTAAWVTLKGVGLTLSLLVYGVVESALLRYRLASNARN